MQDHACDVVRVQVEGTASAAGRDVLEVGGEEANGVGPRRARCLREEADASVGESVDAVHREIRSVEGRLPVDVEHPAVVRVNVVERNQVQAERRFFHVKNAAVESPEVLVGRVGVSERSLDEGEGRALVGEVAVEEGVVAAGHRDRRLHEEGARGVAQWGEL